MLLEESEEYFGENKVLLLQFMRRMLQWDPNERQRAREPLERLAYWYLTIVPILPMSSSEQKLKTY